MKKIIALVTALLSPLSVFAQAPLRDFNDVTDKATGIGQTLIVILISLSVIWIVYNTVRYLISAKDDAERKEGGLKILYGVIGLFIILSIWGFVAIFKNTFVTEDRVPTEKFPTIPSPRGINTSGSNCGPGDYDPSCFPNSSYSNGR